MSAHHRPGARNAQASKSRRGATTPPPDPHAAGEGPPSASAKAVTNTAQTSTSQNLRYVRPTGNNCPIDKLPPEILSKVFLWLKPYISSFIPALEALHDDPYEWLLPTITCRYWWHVAEACPELWSIITWTYERKEFIKACLRRSKDVPLEVYALREKASTGAIIVPTTRTRDEEDLIDEDTCDENLEFLRLISPHIHRLRVFHFNLSISKDDFRYLRGQPRFLKSVGFGCTATRYGSRLPPLFVFLRFPPTVAPTSPIVS